MTTVSYPSEVTDAQWAQLQPLLRRSQHKLGRPPSDAHTMRNAILYVLRGGIPWRFLPKEDGPWATV